jgi:transmembrane sensor
MEMQRIVYLLKQHRKELLTREEHLELLNLIKQDPDGSFFVEAMMEDMESDSIRDTGNMDRWKEIVRKILAIDSPEAVQEPLGSIKRISFVRRWRWVAAAMLLLTIGAAITYQVIKKGSAAGQLAHAILHDVAAPTGNKTTLTLGDGSIITLDSVTAGQLATQGKTRIDKTSSGQIVYSSLTGKASTEILVNTLSTGYGGFTKVVLPDGSRVWLNSLSSLRFPNVFSGRDREVELTGEAFFEIQHDRVRPFHISVNGADIEVLGTHFDIDAYANEPAQKTTLLEGAVKVGAGGHSVVLAPGQQAEVGSDAVAGSIRVLKNVDTDQAIAWVGGNFEFSSDGLESVMHQLERWYNIEVKFETKPTVHISGSVSKKRNLSEVLNVLKISGVDYSIEGRTVTIK